MLNNMLPITRPNPIETRDRLRMLPRSGDALQQTIQYLTRAAQGNVANVEPYIALSELNEIKRDMAQQQSTQATAGAAQEPLVQTLPKEVEQSAGIASLQAARQKQSANNMAQNAARTAGPVPDGIPQPAPPDDSNSGLMSLPAGNALNYRSGGIVAFAEPDDDNNNSLVTSDDDDDDDADNASGDQVAALDPEQLEAAKTTTADARARMATLQSQINKRLKAKAPTAESEVEVRNRLAKDDPERYGILNTPIGKDQLSRLAEFQQLQQAEINRRRQENQPSFGSALIAGAEASRGQKGIANIGALMMGAGRNAEEQRLNVLKGEQGLRGDELGLSEAKMLAENRIDELRRAQAEGDVVKIAKAKMELAKIEKDWGVSINTLLGKETTANMGYLGRVDSANITADAKIRAANAARNKPPNTKLPELLGEAEVALAAMNPNDPAYPAQEAKTKALRSAVAQNKTSDMGPNRAAIMREANLIRESEDVRAKMQSFKYTPAYLNAMSIGDDAEAARLWNAELEIQRSVKPAAPAAPAAPGAAPVAGIPLPANPTAANLRDGVVYATNQGALKWDAAKGKFISSTP